MNWSCHASIYLLWFTFYQGDAISFLFSIHIAALLEATAVQIDLTTCGYKVCRSLHFCTSCEIAWTKEKLLGLERLGNHSQQYRVIFHHFHTVCITSRCIKVRKPGLPLFVQHHCSPWFICCISTWELLNPESISLHKRRALRTWIINLKESSCVSTFSFKQVVIAELSYQNRDSIG